METNIRKNVLWNTTGSIFYNICQWVITILVVHISTYEVAGQLSLAMTTSSSFLAIALFSMRNYQISDVTDKYSIDIYIGSRIFTCVLALVMCIIVTYISSNSLVQILSTIAFMLIRIGEALVDVLHGVNQKYNRYDLIGKSFIIRGFVTITVFTIGMINTNNLFICLLIIAIINLVVALAYDWRKTFSLQKFKPMILNRKMISLLKECFPIVVFTFLLSMVNLIPKILLEQSMGEEALGVYSTIAAPTLIVQVGAALVFAPFLPSLAVLFRERNIKRSVDKLNKINLMLAIMAIVVIILAEIFGEWGLKLLFGNYIIQYSYLLMPIVISTILLAAVWILSSMVIALRASKALLISMIVDFMILIIFAKPLIDAYGQNGASFVQILALTAYVLCLIIITQYKVKTHKK